MWDPYSEFQSATLPNGLTVHVAHWPGRPWEIMKFLVHSGATQDPIGLEGVAHFVEHLISNNARFSSNEIKDFFEDLGGGVSLGATGYPYTHYGFFVPNKKKIFVDAFSLFGHMLLSEKLEQFIERERQVILCEFDRFYPMEFKLDLAKREHKTLYAGCWLERFVRPFGMRESIKQITQSDLQAYYDAQYTPANISIIGVGGATLQELTELLSESPFALAKSGTRTPIPNALSTIAPPPETRYVFEVSEHIGMKDPLKVCEYHSTAKIPADVNMGVARIAAEMLEKILFEEMRSKRAQTYSINVSRHNFLQFYTFSIDCDGFSPEALDDIESVVESCIASLSEHEALFEKLKRSILLSTMMIDPTARDVCAGALDDLVGNNRIISLGEYCKDVERVTMQDMKNLLQWLRVERRWTLIIKP